MTTPATGGKAPERADGRIALVTGADKGLGREIVRRLGALGMTVLAGARDPERGRRAVAALRDTYEVNVFGVVAVTNAMLPLLRQSPAARVVNLSSPLGSLALHADPASQIADVRLLAYNSAKAALNAITLMYANQLRGTGILVNAVNPGYVATDLNQHQGTLTVQQGAIVPVQAATLAGDGPTGAFLGADGPLPW